MYPIYTSLTETKAKVKDCVVTLHQAGLGPKKIVDLLAKELHPIFKSERMVKYYIKESKILLEKAEGELADKA